MNYNTNGNATNGDTRRTDRFEGVDVSATSNRTRARNQRAEEAEDDSVWITS
ncbi:MAG: hypothetical protein R2818_05085 [Flavobacteriales bacterium]